MMNFDTDRTAAIRGFLSGSEEEAFQYVCQEMRECLGEDAPDEEDVRSYLCCPEAGANLSTHEQLIAMDKLLEFAEVSFRTICDLIRYGMMRDAGMVHSMDEFLEMFRPEEDYS